MEGKRDLKKEMEELHIVYVDAVGSCTEADMFAAIDAIKKHLKEHPDSEKIAHIKASIANREKRLQESKNK